MAEIEKERIKVVKDVIDQKYEYGLPPMYTEIIEKGLNDVVRLISQKKGELDWMLEFRLESLPITGRRSRSQSGDMCTPPELTTRRFHTMPTLWQRSQNKEIDPGVGKNIRHVFVFLWRSVWL